MNLTAKLLQNAISISPKEPVLEALFLRALRYVKELIVFAI